MEKNKIKEKTENPLEKNKKQKKNKKKRMWTRSEQNERVERASDRTNGPTLYCS